MVSFLSQMSIVAQNLSTHKHNQTSSFSTAIFKVGGNCEMCKARIEKAAKMNGVSVAEWNMKTGMLKLIYNSSVVSPDQVQKKIAAVGYDTDKFKADNKTYNALPGCCQYERVR